MKTKFLINSEIFLQYGSLEDCFKFYEKDYKDDGYIFDEKNQDCYIIFDEKFDFIKGDMVTIFGITRIVDWKETDITNKIIIYSLEEY